MSFEATNAFAIMKNILLVILSVFCIGCENLETSQLKVSISENSKGTIANLTVSLRDPSEMLNALIVEPYEETKIRLSFNGEVVIVPFWNEPITMSDVEEFYRYESGVKTDEIKSAIFVIKRKNLIAPTYIEPEKQKKEPVRVPVPIR